MESGGGTHIRGTLKDERSALKTGHLSAKDSTMGTLREGPSTGDPDRYVKQGSDMGVCFDRGPAFWEHGVGASFLGPSYLQEFYTRSSREMQNAL